MRRAIAQPGKQFNCRRLKVRKDGSWLRIALPSGRVVCYPGAAIVKGDITYMGVNPYSRKWQRLKTYGGKRHTGRRARCTGRQHAGYRGARLRDRADGAR